MNIKQLREYLDAKEKAWTETDIEWLGPFELQEIQTPHFTKHDDGQIYFAGFGEAEIILSNSVAEFVIQQKE